MNPAVRAKLSEEEQKQLGRAFESCRQKQTRGQVWSVEWSVVGVIIMIAALLLAVGLPLIIPFEILNRGMAVLFLFLFVVGRFASQVANQRNYDLLRRLHDIAAAALNDKGERNAT